MLFTLLRAVRRTDSTQSDRNSGITIKIFLYCSIPTLFLSSAVTLFIASLTNHDNGRCYIKHEFPISDQLDVTFQVKLPVPDSYVTQLTLIHNGTIPIFNFSGNDICQLKSLLAHCVTNDNGCILDGLKQSEKHAMYDTFGRIVLC